MFGSTALNIVIGLILIYLLYSLLATIIGEIVATGLGLRARNLERAIKRMLDDETKDEVDNKVTAFFVSLFALIRGFFIRNRKGLVKKFYDEPVIKYLSSNKFFSKPSYISPENFSKALIDILKRDGEGIGDVEKVKNALRASYKTKNREHAIQEILARSDTEEEKVRQIKSVFQTPLGKDTASHILSLMEDANNDLKEFKLRLEQWFDDTMEQSTGWYKRNMQVILLLTGLCLASLFNASTLDIVNKLSKDKVAREQLVRIAAAYVEENDSLVTYLREIQTDTSSKYGDEINLKLDTLLNIQTTVQKDINDAGSLLGTGWNLPQSLYFTSLNAKREPPLSKFQMVDSANSIVIYFPENLDFKLAQKCYTLKFTEPGNEASGVANVKFRQTSYFLKQIWQGFWGYLLTGLAISLGAPFWFDLLSKLVKIRSEIPKTPKQRVID